MGWVMIRWTLVVVDAMAGWLRRQRREPPLRLLLLGRMLAITAVGFNQRLRLKGPNRIEAGKGLRIQMGPGRGGKWAGIVGEFPHCEIILQLSNLYVRGSTICFAVVSPEGTHQMLCLLYDSHTNSN